jgi:DNA-binding NarL/FixJ family response regulator
MHVPYFVKMIRVAIADDNASYRKALELLISKTQDFEIVYADSSGEGLVKICSVLDPEVVIMDIEMPGMNGIQAVKAIKEQCPATQIFMLTVFEDDENIFNSIKAGAIGYLLKKDPPELIIDAIRKVHNGESIINGKIARKMLDYFAKNEARRNSIHEYNLTRREKEILQLLMGGLSYKEIASQCIISMDTMFSHIRKIYSKLNVHSRSEIAARFR